MTSTSEVARAAAVIRAGGLGAFPTETVYGLGANALDTAAVERIYAAKGRPATSPLIVHVPDLETAKSLVTAWPERAEELARRYWPGPLTMVLPKRSSIPDRVTAGLGTVGIRVPRHPVALALLREAGVPIAAPSANRFTQLSPTESKHLDRSLADVVLEGGSSEVGLESTVVSFQGGTPVLLRPGVLAIEDALPPADVSGAHPSPGMHARHYAPRTRLVLGQPPAAGRGFVWELPSDPSQCAAQLYATLHKLDAMNLDWISVELPPDLPEWAAVRDRLTRAAS